MYLFCSAECCDVQLYLFVIFYSEIFAFAEPFSNATANTATPNIIGKYFELKVPKV